MENENLKEKIIIKSEKIQELLDCINEIKKRNTGSPLDILKTMEMKCYDIMSKKCIVRWLKRLRQNKINNLKIKKKGIIFQIK